MNSTETAEYLRDHYSREEYILLTLVSCSLLMSAVKEKYDILPPEFDVVEQTLLGLRESMDERELLTVSMMLAEIDRLRGDEVGSET